MATNENLIPIPGRLHSVATEGHVAGADEIFDDTLNKDQATINSEVNAAIGTGGSVDSRITAAINALDASASQIAALSNGNLNLSVTETNGKVTAISGSIDDAAYIDNTESSPAVVPGFDPTTDTVHVTAQVLSESQKAQVRTNIGLGDVDAKINQAVASEASQRAAAVSGVQSSVNAESSRAQAKEAQLQNNIEALTQSNIVVVADHTSVSSPDPLTIYREQGTNTYSDWMYQSGSWNKMAEYDNAIDDEPTAGSNNLVKSGGVAKALYNYIEGKWLDYDDKVMSDSSYCYSDYITISNGDRLELPYATKYAILYDNSKTKLEYWQWFSGRTETISNSNAAYIRYSFLKNDAGNTSAIINSVKAWEPISIKTNRDKINEINEEIEDRKILARNCTINAVFDGSNVVPYQGTLATDVIDVRNRKSNKLEWIYGNASGIILYEYDENMSQVDYWGSTSSDRRRITLSVNTCYVRTTLSMNGDVGIKLGDDMIYTPGYGNQEYIESLDKKINSNNTLSNCLYGYKLNGIGNLVVDSTSIATDFIDVHNIGESILLWWHGYTSSGNDRCCVYYDSSYNVLGYDVQFGGYYREMVLPNDTYYIRVSFVADVAFPKIITKRTDNEIVFTCISDSLNKTVYNKEDGDADNYDSYKVPDFYKAHLDSKIEAINLRDASCGNNSDSFVFISDCHMEFNYNHSPQLVKQIIEKTSVKKVINGGDIIHVQGTKNTAIKALKKWMSRFSFCESYVTIGNHDTNGVNETAGNRLSDSELYGTLIKPFEHKMVSDKKNYYYFDNENQKIRYFVLDIHWPSSPDNRGVSLDFPTQLSWMESKSLEKGSDWSIVVIAHIIYIGFLPEPEICELGQDLIDKLDEMADDSSMPSIIGVFCGHTHYDYATYSQKGYPIIATTCDSSFGIENNEDIGFYTVERTPLTIREQAFDVVHIDKTARKIYLERVGYGNNREFTF